MSGEWTTLWEDSEWQIRTHADMGPHVANKRTWASAEFDDASDTLICNEGHDGYFARIPWELLLMLRKAHQAWLSERAVGEAP